MKLTPEQRGQVIARICEQVFAACAADLYGDCRNNSRSEVKKILDGAAEFSVLAASALVDYVTSQTPELQ